MVKWIRELAALAGSLHLIPTWWLETVFNSNSRGTDDFFPSSVDPHTLRHIYT